MPRCVVSDIPMKVEPDFALFSRMIAGESPSYHVHLIELGIDTEMIYEVYRAMGHSDWGTDRDSMAKQRLAVMERLGYDFCNVGSGYIHLPDFSEHLAKDTGLLSQEGGQRNWAEEGFGLIRNWEDFHAIDWDRIQPHPDFLRPYKEHLPKGMKLAIGGSMFEFVMERWMGYEGLFSALHEDLELVEAVFQKVSEVVYRYYDYYVRDADVGIVFHADDLGYKTSLMIHPKWIRRFVIPWVERVAELTHQAGKCFLFHSCGKVDSLIPDLIAAGIDGFHSFQDQILPIADFRARFPTIAALGGVDVDVLARMDEASVRQYVRDMLKVMVPQGRFALGAGNTVTNYMPVNNYLAMIDEARRFSE